MATLQLRFDPALPHQQTAVSAVVDLFEGQRLRGSTVGGAYFTPDLTLAELGIANQLDLTDEQLLANLQAVQARNGIDQSQTLAGHDFAIEMETGTGKTYAYLRSAFELHALYGFTKFVIVVPTIPIREGVLHSIETMRDHFRTLYDGVPFKTTVYDGSKPNQLRQFATASELQFLIINIQAFNKDIDASEAGASRGNNIYKPYDSLHSNRPIDFIQQVRPIVIIDEPQKILGGEASARGILNLNPLLTLRYSATHDLKRPVPMLYRLGPIEAFDQQLVKQIEVLSLSAGEQLNDAFVELIATDIVKRTATLKINVGSGAKVKQKNVTVKGGNDLFVKSMPTGKEDETIGRLEYRDGYLIENISFESGNEYVEFSNGVIVEKGKAANDLTDDLMREQVFQTVRTHFEREKKLRQRGIKVLSLFFIDRVSNYRVYESDDTGEAGKIARWFEEAFAKTGAMSRFQGLITDPVSAVHDGYFAQDKSNRYKESSETAKTSTAADNDAYELIMRNKERLLSLDEPLRFIFSHSALREGWDNPNVFQICTLRESKSETSRRQEIGRGLRLPVDQSGERVRDPEVNRLTVISSEAYESFAAGLQTEYERESDAQFGKVPPIAFAQIELGDSGAIGQDASRDLWNALESTGYLDAGGKPTPKFAPDKPGFALELPEQYAPIAAEVTDALRRYSIRERVTRADRAREQIRFDKQVTLDPDFEAFWTQISQKTRFRVRFDTDKLVEETASRIREQAVTIKPAQITSNRALLNVEDRGIGTKRIAEGSHEIERRYSVPDVLTYLQNETELTRQTLARILIASGVADKLIVNPQAFLTMATKQIAQMLHRMMIDGIEYERTGDHWDMKCLEPETGSELERYLDKLYQMQQENGHPVKSPYSAIEFQSEVEKRFAESLDRRDDVRFFLKLPAWFKVETPIGPYNPDWAIMRTDADAINRLYLVCETKGTTDAYELRGSEGDKITCGIKHFAAIDVGFTTANAASTALM